MSENRKTRSFLFWSEYFCTVWTGYDYLEYKNNRKRDKGRNSGYNCRGRRKRRWRRSGKKGFFREGVADVHVGADTKEEKSADKEERKETAAEEKAEDGEKEKKKAEDDTEAVKDEEKKTVEDKEDKKAEEVPEEKSDKKADARQEGEV